MSAVPSGAQAIAQLGAGPCSWFCGDLFASLVPFLIVRSAVCALFLPVSMIGRVQVGRCSVV